MIRFINLKDQITEGANEFAFYDTVTDSFCWFSGSQRWSSVEEFKQDYDDDDLQRFLNLIPKNWGLNWNSIILSIGGQEIDIKPINYRKDEIIIDDYEFSKEVLYSLRCRCDTIEQNKWEIAVLESNLNAAITSEDYLKADEIKKQIEDLKDGSKR